MLLVCVSPTFALDDGDVTEPLGGTPRAGLEVLYVNGFNTPEAAARDTAESLGERLGIGTRLVWNELDDVLLDAPALAVEKLFDFDTGANAATSTLTDRLADRATAGQTTWVVAHSAGTLCVRNAVHELEDRWEDKPDAERAALYDRIRLIHIGGAVFDEGNFWGNGWPEGLRILRINDAADGVAQFVGDGPWGDDLARGSRRLQLPPPHHRAFLHPPRPPLDPRRDAAGRGDRASRRPGGDRRPLPRPPHARVRSRGGPSTSSSRRTGPSSIGRSPATPTRKRHVHADA